MTRVDGDRFVVIVERVVGPVLVVWTNGGEASAPGSRRRPALPHDAGIDAADRVPGALVVLFARLLSRVARLTVDDLKVEQGRVALRLGDTPSSCPSRSL